MVLSTVGETLLGPGPISRRDVFLIDSYTGGFCILNSIHSVLRILFSPKQIFQKIRSNATRFLIVRADNQLRAGRAISNTRGGRGVDFVRNRL